MAESADTSPTLLGRLNAARFLKLTTYWQLIPYVNHARGKGCSSTWARPIKVFVQFRRVAPGGRQA